MSRKDPTLGARLGQPRVPLLSTRQLRFLLVYSSHVVHNWLILSWCSVSNPEPIFIFPYIEAHIKFLQPASQSCLLRSTTSSLRGFATIRDLSCPETSPHPQGIKPGKCLESDASRPLNLPAFLVYNFQKN